MLVRFNVKNFLSFNTRRLVYERKKTICRTYKGVGF